LGELGKDLSGRRDVAVFIAADLPAVASSVTGVKFVTGVPFDVERVSDFDIAVSSPSLLRRARELGVPLRSGGTRTAPLESQDLEALGLKSLVDELSQGAGRPVAFMVFDSVDSALARGPSILVPRK
jgi:filamentous hemagglutinin